MSDLKKTQAQWDRFLGREVVGMYLAALAELQAFEERFTRQRTPLLVLGDVHQNHVKGGVALSGVDLGVNTSPGGHLFVRITGNADPRTVSVYKAVGGAAANLVARGRGDTGTDVALAEQRGSGLSGKWELPAAVTVDTTDRLRVYPVPDWRVRMQSVWDGSHPKDAQSQREFLDALEAVTLRIRDARLIVQEAFVAFATHEGSRGAEFLGTTSGAMVTDTPVRDPSGARSRRRTGFLVDLSRAMAAESVAGPQSVAERQVKAQAAVFAATNRGQGRVAAHAPREYCPAARWTFRCVRGQESGFGGQEEFECVAKLLGEERTIRFGGVRVKQSFAGPEGIGPFVLERIYAKDGDPGDRVLAPTSSLTTTGERRGNTEAGLLHWEATPRGQVWDVSFYRSASRASGDLMAKAEGVAPGARFQAAERNASGLSLSWGLGPQPSAARGTLDCNFFRESGPTGVPDTFVVETSAVAEGMIQRLLAEQLGGSLHQWPVGSPSVVDSALHRGGLISLSEA